MKSLNYCAICLLLVSCTYHKNSAQNFIFEGTVCSISGVTINGVTITVEAMYSRYPNPDFALDSNDYMRCIDDDLKLDTTFLNKYKKIIFTTFTYSSGKYKLLIPQKVLKNTWFYNHSFPKYKYIRLIFRKNRYKTVIFPFVPNCENILNNLKNVKLEIE